MATQKTNVMRILDSAKINYNMYTYDSKGGAIDGVSVAEKIGQPVERVYKTLVTRGNSKNFFVFVIPVSKELNLKAAAKAVGEKSIEMIRVDEINKVTGYIRGGCSPIGMKKDFKTVIDSTCKNLATIIFSGGKIGFQVEVNPKELVNFIKAGVENITE
ncbi:Cys-tRNA(Pro) deacylase [Ruminiclostridium cellulolyticum]|uniref:Cys-tRNA(Pro)/Cys-tRNA(Cys) deacylase n=1 Tax=Ruminiclostridium cellulolyticum (strain ATCC 35319 / DSM 5812 / JCM 6584 / H10) TaxID=394503 RepID=B8I779_RUMCH|nr:Cys-tRNA(Pro) deacylase [Ruminiclostridium cellulolyticum]ACL75003.1 ybaK/ebsC protein [Ruminiclostridium cellulolyticum H10]